MSAGAGRGCPGGGGAEYADSLIDRSASRNRTRSPCMDAPRRASGSAAGADDSMNENEQPRTAGDAPAPPASHQTQFTAAAADAQQGTSSQGAPGQPGAGRRPRRRRGRRGRGNQPGQPGQPGGQAAALNGGQAAPPQGGAPGNGVAGAPVAAPHTPSQAETSEEVEGVLQFEGKGIGRSE